VKFRREALCTQDLPNLDRFLSAKNQTSCDGPGGIFDPGVLGERAALVWCEMDPSQKAVTLSECRGPGLKGLF
jgi:hypothetical protein